MNLRHLATKEFGTKTIINKSVLYDESPIVINESSVEEIIDFGSQLPKEVSTNKNIQVGKENILKSPLGSVIADKETGNILSLSSIFDYKVDENSVLSQELDIGTEFKTLFESPTIKGYLSNIAEDMFGNINPLTNKPDIDSKSFYAPYIPLVTLSGCITPQLKDGQTYFNPQGTVSIAEFLDGLNAIKYGANSNRTRKKTLDNISNEDDYFNEGYQACLGGISSPFFNLYRRDELVKPITRLELAYITVVCWTPFMEKYNNLYGGTFYLGINFDWELPYDALDKYVDGFDYKVSKVSRSKQYNITSLNIKDYTKERTVSQYKDDIKIGKSAIALPAYMSLVELGLLDLFRFEGNRLDPLKEVSREELAYFLTKVAQQFPTKYNN